MNTEINNPKPEISQKVESEASETKLEYTTPQLTVHGQVEKITMSEPSGPFGDEGDI